MSSRLPQSHHPDGRRAGSAFSVAAACFAAIATVSARAADDPLIAQVREAWQERQQRFETFVVEWDELRTTLAGAIRDDGRTRYPPEDVTHLMRQRVSGAREGLRYWRSGLIYDFDLRKFAPKDYAIVFNGRESRTLYTGEKEGRHPPGFVSHGMAFPTASYHVQAVFVGFRPLVTALGGIDLAECRVSPRPGVVGGVRCRILEANPKPRFAELYWVAADGDWRVLRHERAINGRVFSQLTIDYEERAGHGTVPVGWTHASRNEQTGQVMETIVSRVTSSEFNLRLPRAEFELPFPPGAIVQGPEKNSIAVVRTDGTLRPISQGELAMGVRYEDLMQTKPPPEAVPAGTGWSGRTALIVFFAALVLVAAWLWWRTRATS